jgi:hypothetical protein
MLILTKIDEHTQLRTIAERCATFNPIVSTTSSCFRVLSVPRALTPITSHEPMIHGRGLRTYREVSQVNVAALIGSEVLGGG